MAHSFVFRQDTDLGAGITQAFGKTGWLRDYVVRSGVRARQQHQVLEQTRGSLALREYAIQRLPVLFQSPRLAASQFRGSPDDCNRGSQFVRGICRKLRDLPE